MSGEATARRAPLRVTPGSRPRRAHPRLALGAALVALVLLFAAKPAAAAEDPAKAPPFGGEPVPKLVSPGSRSDPPPGFRLSGREAIRIANRTEAVREERSETPSMRPRAFTRGPDLWQVSYFDAGIEVAQVVVDDRSGEVVEEWRDHQVGVKLARGYEDAVARDVSEAWIWLPLCVLFIAPFIDPRRPLRLLHLDLLVLLGFSVSLFFFNKGEITISVPLVYPVLAYIFGRMLLAGLRPRERAGPLIPLAPFPLLLAGIVALAVFRVALNVIDSSVIDIGLAGVVGADRLTSGEGVYDGIFAPGIDLRGDVYGPFNYIAYAPFEAAFPWSGAWDGVPAAHAASISFDLLTAGALVVLGRRLRPAREGTVLGVALAYAWLAYPFTLYALGANTNDSLVALLLVLALIVVAAPPARGAALARGATLALAAAAKFGPLVLAPLFAAGTGERRRRSLLPFAIAFLVVWALVLIPLLPDGGPREFYDRTLGYQAGRGSPFSLWGLAPWLDWLQTLTRVLAVLFGLVLFFVPRRRDATQIAALGAAVLIATQAGSQHWFYFFIAWFAPYVLVALFASQRRIEGPRPPSRGAASPRSLR